MIKSGIFSILFVMLIALFSSMSTFAEDKSAVYYELINEVRCLVCQNQSVAESSAPLALDMRNQIDELLQKGYSKEEVKDHLSQRFGDYLLYEPKFNIYTFILWIAPFVFFILIVYLLVIRPNRRPKTTPTTSNESP